MFVGASLALCLPAPATAQHARMPAAWVGTAPPAEIAGLRDVRPLIPLEFSRAWLAKVEQVRRQRAELHATGELNGMTPEQAAARGAALSGVLRIPVVAVRYADVAEPFPIEHLERRLFGPNAADTMSFAGYWDEVSGGLLRVEGDVTPWVTLSRRAAHYLPAERYGWGEFGRVAQLRDEALRALDELIDLRLFDNDGPDGVPNSGDDDGYVDFVAIVYAMPCHGDRREGAIWPHRAAMSPFETRHVLDDGERLRITDYLIIPAVDPLTCGPAHIGLLAHETGHALGLPDLYDYDGSSQGIGAWGLMGTGSHNTRYSPAHLGAWAKEQLGWVRVVWLEDDDAAFTIPPVATSRTVYRYDSPDRPGEYILLENRQPLGSDRRLPGSGLLVWHVDPERGELGAWNNDERRTAVSIIEADGRGDLRAGRPADAGDPFPGDGARDVFLSARASDLYLSRIRERDDGVVVASLRVGYSPPGLVARPYAVRLTGLAGGASVRQAVDIRRVGGADYDWSALASRPWLHVEAHGDVLHLTADPNGLAVGEHADTVRLYDAAGGEAGFVHVGLYVALPGVGQVVATELPWSWGLAARDGRVYKASYGWDAVGLRPRPRLLELREGAMHPATLARLPADAIYAPVIASDGSTLVIARANDENFLYRLAPDGSAGIVAARFGTGPAYGAAALANGHVYVAEWNGRIHRIAPDGTVTVWADLDAQLYQIASDGTGAVYAATFAGDVQRVDAAGIVTVLPTGFGRGRMVALDVTASGVVYAAERGGEGRIIRIDPGGVRTTIFRRRDAQFYGIAVEGDFLYALDLGERLLLRIPLEQTVPPVILVDAS